MADDSYSSFHQLGPHLKEGRDFRIEAVWRPSPYAIVAPHGGGIEEGTSEVAAAIAASDHALYLFEGIGLHGNTNLHITSARFNEPRCLDLVSRVETVVTVHGMGGAGRLIRLGGLDLQLIGRMIQALTSAGFVARRTNNLSIAGTYTNNICNRGTSARGCQLEISRGLRQAMFLGLDSSGRKHPRPELGQFAEAVRRALML